MSPLLFCFITSVVLSSAVEIDCEYPSESIIVQQPPSPDTDYSKDNFAIEKTCITSNALTDGQVLLKALYISVDPYLSGVFRNLPNPPFTASSLQISQVMASKSDRFNVGNIVTIALHESTGYADVLAGHSEWSTYFIRNDTKLFRIDHLNKDVPLYYYLSSLGVTGATAYYGLLDIGLMKSGENLFVSGAAGATGSVVGQIGKNVLNGYVVGTAGNRKKTTWLTEELGFDAAINYKQFGNDPVKLRQVLQEKFPNGIDVYFDNTGGFVTEAVWPLLNQYARVVLCGQIANYNRVPPKIDDFLTLMVFKEIRAEGFSVTSMKPERWEQFYKDLSEWTTNGKVISKHTVVDGFENTIEAFMGLFSGRNTGKMIVKVADPN